MLRFLISFFIVCGLVQFYLFTKFRVFFPEHPQAFAILWLIFSLIVIALPTYEVTFPYDSGAASPWLYAIGFSWLAFAFLLAFLFGCFDFIAVVSRHIGYPNVSEFLRSNAFTGGLSLFIGLLITLGLFSAQQINIYSVSIPTHKLPENIDHFRIVQLSDLHLNPMFRGEKIAEIMSLVRAQNPDIVVFTGDTVERHMEGYDKEAKLLADHNATYGSFGIEGNHEHYAGINQSIAFLERAGMSVLRNEMVSVGPIVLIGEIDPGRGRDVSVDIPPINYSDLNLPEDRYVILLKHRPNVVDEIQGVVDLQLSGHTHKGQVWPAYWITRLAFDYLPGLSQKDKVTVYVSNGTGFWGPPVRVLAPPEITVIDLVRTSQRLSP